MEIFKQSFKKHLKAIFLFSVQFLCKRLMLSWNRRKKLLS